VDSKQRLDYLVDILDFETRARLAQRIS